MPGVDMKALPIGPEEAFVLSRVDGKTSEPDIAMTTGLDDARVSEALKRLRELGAIRFEGEKAQPAQREPSEPRTQSGAVPAARNERPAAKERRSPSFGALAALRYDPAELEQDADLEPERKQKLLDIFYLLDDLSHYELLGVSQSAEKKDIKQAYYEVVATFHPDRYFGKNLGSFKPKLEKVFARMTEAHDVLTRKRSREEYDEYLSTQRRTKALEQQIADARTHAAELESARARIGEQAEQAAGTESAPPPPEPASSPPPAAESSPPAPSSSAPPDPETSAPSHSSRPPVARRTPSARPSDSAARRKALARKLASGSSIPPARISDTPPADPEAVRAQAAESLRRHFDQRVVSAKRAQIRRYQEVADQSLSDNNPVAAANALRIAVSLAPDDLQLMASFEEVQNRANVELAETYLNQARYEERSGRYAEAASSYARAAAGKPSASSHERAAHCALEAHGDVRTATEHARKAVALDPDNAVVRLTLGRAYLESNMRQSATAELERAAALDPNDETIQAYLKRVKRSRG